MIAGFVIPPGPDRKLLIRGVGPELVNYGILNFLPNPRITLMSEGSVIAENDDWTGAETQQATQSVNAFTLAEGSRDAALVTTLPAGIYTVILSDVSGCSGVALAEVYELPE